jgi:hypothetical protein
MQRKILAAAMRYGNAFFATITDFDHIPNSPQSIRDLTPIFYETSAKVGGWPLASKIVVHFPD